MSETLFFDAYVCYGQRTNKHPQHAWRLSEVLEEMDHCSISGALVAHTLSTSYDPMWGNMKLVDDIKGHDHLYPMWVAIPHHTGDFPEPEHFVKLMKQHNVNAVKLCPASMGWDIASPANKPLLQTLNDNKIFTVMSVREVGWEKLEQVLATYPELPILITHNSFGTSRYVFPLFKTYPNLYLGFDHYQIHYGLELFVSLGYEDRLLFTSNAPEMSIGAHRTYISYADFSDEIKAKIAGGNLKRLLKGQGPEKIRHNENEDSIMKNARMGKAQEVPVRDMHIHMLHEGLNGNGGNLMYRGGPEGTYSLMRRLGYQGGGIMSWNVVIGDSQGGNECVKEALKTFPETFWGLGSFDASHYSQKDLEAMIPEFYQDKRMVGMKPYWCYGMRYDDPLYDVWWKYANDHGLYGLMHRVAGDYSEIDNLAGKYPNVSWVVAHCGANYAAADGAIEVIQKHPNVFAEITLTPVTFGVIDYLVENCGEDRVVYGSDLPMRDPRQQLGWVMYSRLSESAKAKVMGGNAAAIVEKVNKFNK